jgi:hypothetical protein
MKRHIPPPIFMLIAAVLMWALCRWWPMAHWIGRPWNRLGALPAAIGLAIAVDAVRRDEPMPDALQIKNQFGLQAPRDRTL